MPAIAGTITESLDITDWRVTATKCKDGTLSGTSTTNGSSYSVTCLDNDICNVLLAPKIDYPWSAAKAVIVGDFVVPSNPDGTPHLWKATTSPAGDPNYSSRKLILNFNGTDNSTVFTDGSATPHTVTAYGAAKISSNKLLLDGAVGSYAGTDSSVDFDWSSINRTLECFINPTALGAIRVIFGGHSAANDAKTAVYVYPDGSIAIGKIGTNESKSASGAVVTGTEQHIAVLISDTQAVVTVDGAVKVTTDFSRLSSGSATLNIGFADPTNASCFNGTIDGVRVSNRLEYSIAGFTPPANAFLESALAVTGSVEPSWNLSGTTDDANGIIWTYVAPLVDPVALGPKKPS